MNRKYILILLVWVTVNLSAQQSFTVTASGFTFNPQTISAKSGDNVTFAVGSSHPVLQVSESTWNANGGTALPGGFAFPSGSGTLVLETPGTMYYICENHISMGMKGKIEVSDDTGVDPNPSKNLVKCYPNPASKFLYILTPDNYKVQAFSVYDMSGQKIYDSERDDIRIVQNSLDISGLKKGLYIIRFTFQDQTTIAKFIKE